MKLGQRVECSSYLKKKAIPYVFANDNHIEKHIEKHHFSPYNYINLEKKGIDDYMRLDTKETIRKTFNGIVIAKASVSTANIYEQAEEHFTQCLLDEVVCRKDCYVECYRVAYALGKTRLVPINDIREMEQ